MLELSVGFGKFTGGKDMNQKVNEWIEAHRNDLLEDIKDLCSVNSVKGSYEQGKPFGDGPFDALNEALQLCESYGFSISNYENYVGTADLDPKLPRSLDILAHMDVVPAGEGWTVTEPFDPIEKDGRIYGRGSSDDKGPAMCALYAMRAVRECGIPLKKGVRLILGADEECGSSDIEKYYANEPEAEMTFSPDGEFPVINIEKGMFRGTISKNFTEDPALPRVLSMDAGIALNAVPQKAVIRLEGFNMNLAEKIIADLEKECDVKCEMSGIDEITVIGTSAHASTPENGRNAGLAALMLISRLPLADSEELRQIRRLLKLFPYGVTDGSGIGVKMEDRESHALTCTLDLFHIDPQYIEFKFDARVPVTADQKNCEEPARKAIEKAGFDFTSGGMIPPHVVPSDSGFVKKLLKSYEDVTGLKSECLAIGGGTYVHELKNGVAFGAVLPGIDTHMHGADEFMEIDNIMAATKIYADAIIALCS